MPKRATPAKIARKEYEKGFRPVSHAIALDVADRIEDQHHLTPGGARALVQSLSPGQLAVTISMAGVQPTPEALQALSDEAEGRFTEVWLVNSDQPATLRQMLQRIGTKRVRCG